MAFWDFLFKKREKIELSLRPQSVAGKRARVTIDNASDVPFFGAFNFAPKRDSDRTWKIRRLDSKTLDRMDVDELIELLVDVSPEISRALFDFIRMFNPGYEVKALWINSDRQHTRGQKVLDDFFTQIKDLYGTPDIVLNRLILAGFIRGAFAAEIVLDKRGKTGVDLATPDPFSFDFRKIKDEIRGSIWQLGQWINGEFVPLDIPTVSYIPIDPLPNSPFGRPLISSAVFIATFIIAIMHDLKRVIQQQGYPRIDLSIDLEKLAEAIPGELDTEQQKAWVAAVIDEVQEVYSRLQPDDAYVHTSVVEVNNPVGTLDANLSAIDQIISALERMAIRALKTMPLLMGVNEAASETHANRQWELHAAGIKSIQHLLESLLEKLLSIVTRAAGIQCVVEFRFAELRASEMLRDEQTKTMKYSNLITAYDQGWISQEEAALEAVGHKPDQEEPRQKANPFAEMVEGDGEGEEPENEELDEETERIIYTNGNSTRQSRRLAGY